MIEFIEFLHRRGVLFAFAMNGGFDNISYCQKEYIVGDAFIWRNTPQGYDIWENIEIAWWGEIGYY